MRTRELVAAIAADTGLTHDQVQAVLVAAFHHLADELVAGGRLEVRNFGIFDVVAHEPRQLHVPKTGQTIALPARRTVRFRELKALRDRLNQPRPKGRKPDIDSC